VLKLQCGNCGHKLAVPATYAGQMIKCPKCSGPITVPHGQAAPPPQHAAPQHAPPPVNTAGYPQQPQYPPPPQQGYPQPGYGQQPYYPQQPQYPPPQQYAPPQQRGPGGPGGGRQDRKPGSRRRPVKRDNTNHIAFVIGGCVLLLAVLIGVIVVVADHKAEERAKIEAEIQDKIERRRQILEERENDEFKFMEGNRDSAKQDEAEDEAAQDE